MKKQNKIGIFSGTFDPFHVAHLEVCLVAKAACGFSEVLIMTEKTPKFKKNVTAYEQRITMAKIATAKFRRLRIVDNNQKNITIDNTLPFLDKWFSGAEYWFIVGSDMIEFMGLWDSVDMLLDNMKLCIVLRSNKDRPRLDKQLEALSRKYKQLRYIILPEVWSELSSSKIRNQIKQTGNSSGIDDAVLSFIKLNRLYT